MSTTTAPETVKEATQKVEANIRAQFIANRKEVLIKKWWDDFEAQTEKSFEDSYREWEIDAYFGILSQPYTIPSIEVCEDALNNTACKWRHFNAFFQEHLQLKK